MVRRAPTLQVTSGPGELLLWHSTVAMARADGAYCPRMSDAPMDSAGGRVLKIRPFDEWFSRGSGLPAARLHGFVEGGRFLVQPSAGPTVPLRASVHEDAEGAYALAKPQSIPLQDGRVLRLEADAEDADCSYASLSCFEGLRSEAAEEDLGNTKRWCSVYFNARGHVDGVGSGAPRSIVPRPRLEN